MKRSITKHEQNYINSLLDKRRDKQMNKILSVSKDRERLQQFNEDNYVQRDGRTALEQQIENHRFRK